ncbi:exopolysaccharide biosynthesis protein, partial [Rhizobiaceae sp. 2RAB30]
MLQEKIKAADASIKSAEAELANVTGLVEKGIAVASRKSDLERSLSSYRMDRLDQVTSVMRAKQAISEATRNEDGLRDRKQTEVAAELQSEQAALTELKRKRELSQKLLLEMLGSPQDTNKSEAQPAITITRMHN